MTQTPLFRLVLTALFTALIVASSFVAIPFVPMPLILANCFTLLAGLVLGPLYGTASVLLYLALGAIGLPVFAGGSGGFAQFAGPTGGFLVGYLPSTALAGLVAHGWCRSPRKVPGRLRLGLASLLGMVVFYLVGVPWFQAVMPTKVPTLWAACLFMSPYMLGDALKVVAAAALGRGLLPLLNR